MNEAAIPAIAAAPVSRAASRRELEAIAVAVDHLVLEARRLLAETVGLQNRVCALLERIDR